mgnify:CR=1 FL=1
MLTTEIRILKEVKNKDLKRSKNLKIGNDPMSKTISCPKCGSKKMKLHVPQTSIWKCGKCGYQGPVFIEDGNLEKQLQEVKKMEKLQKKLLRKR